MADHVPWLPVLEALAKILAAAALYGYLLHRGGIRPAAASTVILAQFLALSCVMPTSAEMVFVTAVTLGTCSYAVLVVDRPWVRAGIVAACFITFGALLAQASAGLFLVAITPLALWTGLMAIIRDWARARPKSKERSVTTAWEEL
jgi:hypothetical protein